MVIFHSKLFVYQRVSSVILQLLAACFGVTPWKFRDSESITRRLQIISDHEQAHAHTHTTHTQKKSNPNTHSWDTSKD